MTNEQIINNYKKALNNCSAKDWKRDVAEMQKALDAYITLNGCDRLTALRTLYNLSR